MWCARRLKHSPISAEVLTLALLREGLPGLAPAEVRAVNAGLTSVSGSRGLPIARGANWGQGLGGRLP